MKIIELLQGSTQWHEFRRLHIGASESAAILGLSIYKTPLKVWEEKVLGWMEPMNANMQRGVELEPLARACFELQTGIKVKPMVAECEIMPFISASFDGVSEDRKTIIEIKCGRSSHRLAKNNVIPDYYKCQLQHQMYISGLEMIFYYSFDGQEGITIIEERDEKFISKMLEKYLEFWNCVANSTPPET